MKRWKWMDDWEKMGSSWAYIQKSSGAEIIWYSSQVYQFDISAWSIILKEGSEVCSRVSKHVPVQDGPKTKGSSTHQTVERVKSQAQRWHAYTEQDSVSMQRSWEVKFAETVIRCIHSNRDILTSWRKRRDAKKRRTVEQKQQKHRKQQKRKQGSSRAGTGLLDNLVLLQLPRTLARLWSTSCVEATAWTVSCYLHCMNRINNDVNS